MVVFRFCSARDPRQLAWRVKKSEGPENVSCFSTDPCPLVRQVKEFARCCRLLGSQTCSPAGRAGRGPKPLEQNRHAEKSSERPHFHLPTPDPLPSIGPTLVASRPRRIPRQPKGVKRSFGRFVVGRRFACPTLRDSRRKSRGHAKTATGDKAGVWAGEVAERTPEDAGVAVAP